MTTIGNELHKLPRITLHISRTKDGWWEIERKRLNFRGVGLGLSPWRFVTVRRCKGTREDAEACAKRYLTKQGDNIGIIHWFDD